MNTAKLFSSLVLIVGLSTLSACNKDSGGGSSAAPAPAAAACGAGYIQSSQYGCLPVGNCPANYGMYQNQCIAVTNNGSCTAGSYFVNNQCLPQGNCQAGYVFNGQTCIVNNNATTPQPYPNFDPSYGAYNNGYYGNQQAYYQNYPQYQQMYYQQPYYNNGGNYGNGCGYSWACGYPQNPGGGSGLGFYFGVYF